MAMSVAVPLHLLEDIFRLLDYSDRLGSHENPHFHKYRRARRFEDDTALRELRWKINQLQTQIVETYLLTVGDITDDEKRDLQEWVNAGKSVYDNPYSLYNESGCPMDFINGCRLGIEMDEDLSHFTEIEPHDIDWGDELPF